MKRFTVLLASLCFALTMLTGCGDYEKIDVSEPKIEKISSEGFRSVNLAFSLDVDNPAKKIDIREVCCFVKLSGKVIGKMTLDPFVVGAKTKGKHHLVARVNLEQGVGLKAILKLLRAKPLGECEFDIYIKGYYGIWPFKKQFKDIPLEDLLDF